MGNTALITGSYGGLESCFVNIHGAKHGDLILVGRSQEKLDKQAAEAEEKYGIMAHTIAVDLSEPSAAQFIYDTCKENNWQVDIIIDNAGFGGQGDFARERTMEQDMCMIAVNVETSTRILKLFLPDMIERLTRYKKLIGPMPFIIKDDADTTTVELHSGEAELKPPKFLVISEFAFLTGMIRKASREHAISVKIRMTESLDVAI